MIRIRRCKDLEVIKKLQAEIFDPDDWVVGLGLHYWFVAWDGGEPVAFGGLQVYTNKVGFLSLSGVLPSHRGIGLQRRLIKSRVRLAYRLNCLRLVTYTVCNNPTSMRSILRCDFQPYWPEHAWAGEEVVYFERNLS